MEPPTALANPAIPSALSPITASINLSALFHNLRQIRQLIPATCDILTVVKADAYGHGSGPIARKLTQQGVRRFGVATVQEGIVLRQQGITQPILVMGGLLPSQLSDLIHHRLTPVLANEEIAERLCEELTRHSLRYPVHVKLDTGMRRLGFAVDSVLDFLEGPWFQRQLWLEGLMTHLADADNDDPTFTNRQLAQFQEVVSHMRRKGLSIPLLHAANSAGILRHPSSHFDLVRPGIMLYGYGPGAPDRLPVSLQPVMRVSTHVVQIRSITPGDSIGYNRGFRASRSMRVAILPVGYAHGYPRCLSNLGVALIHGRRAPIIGKICMDMMFLDVSEVPGAQLGDEVVLLGNQDQEEILADEIAEWAHTIPYEVLCLLGTKAQRVYHDVGQNGAARGLEGHSSKAAPQFRSRKSLGGGDKC